jgi:hypothetical protein
MPDDDPLLKVISPLAGVILAVVISVMVAATVAGRIGDDYDTRAWIYTFAVLWVLVGAVVVFMLAHRGESRNLSVGRVLLWTASIWLWPVFALQALQRRAAPDEPPRD